jgi:DNA-binding transcriptional ArsR family regulator
VKPINDIDDPRLVKALSHPLRVRILSILEQRTATPKQLSEALGVNLENLAYHVRVLRDYGLISLERRTRVGGALEHHYRALARPRVTARAWDQLPEISQRALVGAALEQIGCLVSAAAVEGGFAHPESHVSRRPLVLDADGFAEASKILSAALDDLSQVERRARRRIGEGAEEVATTAVVLLFDTPQRSVPGARAASRADRAHRYADSAEV